MHLEQNFVQSQNVKLHNRFAWSLKLHLQLRLKFQLRLKSQFHWIVYPNFSFDTRVVFEERSVDSLHVRFAISRSSIFSPYLVLVVICYLV